MSDFNDFLFDTRELTANQIIEVLDLVGKGGDIMIIKNDGLRLSNHYTVVISSGNNSFSSIRYDAGDISTAVKRALIVYAAAIKKT